MSARLDFGTIARSRPSCHEVAAQIDGVFERHIDDLVSFGLEPGHDAGLGACEAYRRQLLGHRHDHEVDVHVVFVEKREPRFPAFVLEPSLDLPRTFFLGAAAAAPDEYAAFLDHVEIAAFERAGGHHVVDRNAEPLIGADGGIVLAPTPPVGHRGDDRPIRRHHARVARIDLHRELRFGLMPVDAHAKVRIRALQFPVLRLRDADVGGVLAQRLAR